MLQKGLVHLFMDVDKRTCIFVHICTNNAKRGGEYWLILLSTDGWLTHLMRHKLGNPSNGRQGQDYRNCRRVVINTHVQKVCIEGRLNFIGVGELCRKKRLSHEECVLYYRERLSSFLR